jgi:hypothetical protein
MGGDNTGGNETMCGYLSLSSESALYFVSESIVIF